MTPEGALVWFLKGTGNVPPGSAVTAIVDSRMYWQKLPQGVTYPCLRLQRISTAWSDHRTIDGPVDYAKPRFQIDCWADDQLEAINLAAAVFHVLEGVHGIVGDLRIDPMEIEDEAGDLEEGVGPAGADIYRQRIDVFVPFAAAA